MLEKINKEIDLGRIAGPFTEKPISNLRLNPVGVVPKSNGGWRLISHLSSPLGESVNDFIDPNLCSKGPAILPKSISLLIFSSIAFSCVVAERKCFA
jgi:hypothetical protein